MPAMQSVEQSSGNVSAESLARASVFEFLFPSPRTNQDYWLDGGFANSTNVGSPPKHHLASDRGAQTQVRASAHSTGRVGAMIADAPPTHTVHPRPRNRAITQLGPRAQ